MACKQDKVNIRINVGKKMDVMVDALDDLSRGALEPHNQGMSAIDCKSDTASIQRQQTRYTLCIMHLYHPQCIPFLTCYIIPSKAHHCHPISCTTLSKLTHRERESYSQHHKHTRQRILLPAKYIPIAVLLDTVYHKVVSSSWRRICTSHSYKATSAGTTSLFSCSISCI
jgi:hypothetical protein